jgi:hypothetical protein
MSSSVTRQPNEAIVLVKYTEPFKPEVDVAAVNKQVAKLVQEIPGEIYRIADVSAVQFEFSDIVMALNEATRRENGSLRDNRLHSIFVGTGSMVELAVNSLSQAQYGSIKSLLFTSVDDAICYARSQLGKK